MLISMIAALGGGTRVIGSGEQLLWNLPDDMKRFQQKTYDHPVIVGRTTWLTIPSDKRPLRRRTSIVLSRTPGFEAPGAFVVGSLEEGLEIAERELTKLDPLNEEVVVMGGGEIYQLAIERAKRLYLTRFEKDLPGDVFFPPYEDDFTKVVEKPEPRFYGDILYEFVTLERP